MRFHIFPYLLYLTFELFLGNMLPADALSRFEVRANPVAAPPTKIVEAFGDRKCSKLVEQVADGNIEVRVNALLALCDEVNNPYSIFGICDAGVVPILAAMCNDSDYTTRLRASQALAVMATDANGLETILSEKAIDEIIKGMYDPAEVIRKNIYTCIMHSTRTADGVEACVYAGVTERFAHCLPDEIPSLKTLLLKTLHNMCSQAPGLENALASGVVIKCIELLTSTYSDVRAEAARTLGFICFSDAAKDEALEHNGVGVICSLLANLDELTNVKAAASLALMAITTTDEGKRQMDVEEYINSIIALLYDENRTVKLNALKIISNIAVYPSIRHVLKEDNSCLLVMKRLKNGDDPLVVKHANFALEAVQWMP